MVYPRVRETIYKYGMISPGEKILVGVSGGPDSVCLLHVLKRLAQEMEVSPHIIHINHGIRRREGIRDQNFVKSLAEKLNLPVTIRSINVPSYARRKKLTIEEAAREMRYSVFEKVAKQLGARKVAVGHTADDNVETVLLHFLRGSGPQGLSGISPVRKLGRITVIRPLIGVSREEIVEYLRKNNLTFCLDSSNRRLEYFRNRIRLNLLPLLRKSYNKKIDSSLLRLSEIMREENQYWEKILERIFPRVVSSQEGKILVDLERFLRYNVPVQRRILYKLFGGAVTLNLVEAIRSLATEGRVGQSISLGRKEWLTKTGKFLVLSSSSKERSKKFCYRVQVPGRTEIPELGLEISTRVIRARRHRLSERNIAYFDADIIDINNLTVRNRRQGDKFKPFGMGGTKKLSDFFIDYKVPRYWRENIPLLVEGKEIIWVIGFRRADKAKITQETKKVLEVKVTPMDESFVLPGEKGARGWLGYE